MTTAPPLHTDDGAVHDDDGAVQQDNGAVHKDNGAVQHNALIFRAQKPINKFVFF